MYFESKAPFGMKRMVEQHNVEKKEQFTLIMKLFNNCFNQIRSFG